MRKSREVKGRIRCWIAGARCYATANPALDYAGKGRVTEEAHCVRIREALELGVRLGDVVRKSSTEQPGPHAFRQSDGSIITGEAADAVAALCTAIIAFSQAASEALAQHGGAG